MGRPLSGTRLGGGKLTKGRAEIKTKRKFGGKTFDLAGIVETKAEATQKAQAQRERGFKARIFKLSSGVPGTGRNAGKIARYLVYID